MRSIQHKDIADHQKELTQYVKKYVHIQFPIPYFIVDGRITAHTFIVQELRKPPKEHS